jgi:hypothetical protein
MPSGSEGEVALARFTISGDCDEVTRKLKEAFEANEAKFNAELAATFKSPSPRTTPAIAPAAKPAALRPHGSDAWSLGGSRSSGRAGSGSYNGRLPTSRNPTR